MALINCPECNKEVSDKALACIHCGYPLDKTISNRTDALKEMTENKKFKTAPRMIKCPNCDNKIYETATTCSYCGLQDVKSALIEKERKMESTKPIDTLIKCPNCGSTQIQAVPRKWSLMTGFLTNKIDRVCLNCKNKF